MRIELHLTLWAVAVAAVAYAAVHRPELVPAPPSVEPGASVAAMSVSPIGADSEAPPEVPAHSSIRPLFRIASPEQTQALVVVPEPTPLLPSLKGIIETDAGRRAVFSAPRAADDMHQTVGASEVRYRILGAGEQIGPLLLIDIAADTVVARGTDGEDILLRLRGKGEWPE